MATFLLLLQLAIVLAMIYIGAKVGAGFITTFVSIGVGYLLMTLLY